MSRDADHEVIARSLRDPEAFRVLFDRHFPAIHRYLRHRCGASAADDLAAETFVRAFAARGRYAAHSDDARPWLYAIATNLLRDEVRRGARGAGALRRLGAQRPPAPIEMGEAPDPELAAALADLRAEEREVLLLHAWGELSYEEIAVATGTRVGTVRSRLHRARARLQKALAATPVAVGGRDA